MSKKKMTVDELISFFEMSVKVEGWADPGPSPSYQTVKAFRELVADRDAARSACEGVWYYLRALKRSAEEVQEARELALGVMKDIKQAKE